MRDEDRRTFQSLRGAQLFLQEYAHAIGTIAQTGLVQRLSAIIEAAYAHTTAHAMADVRIPSLAANEQMLLDTLLRDHLTPIVRIARADLPNTPDFKVFRMPDGRPTLDQIIDSARAMGALAERFAGVFAAAGMQPGFVDALHAAADAILRARDARIAMRARRHAAVEGLTVTIAEGSNVLSAIDNLMSMELRHNAALLANWRAMITTPRRMGRPRKRRARR
jgi:hypothetical protein